MPFLIYVEVLSLQWIVPDAEFLKAKLKCKKKASTGYPGLPDTNYEFGAPSIDMVPVLEQIPNEISPK